MYIGQRELKAKMIISDDYRKLCETMHQDAPWGTKGYRYIDDFLPTFRELGCRTLLDYGCGRESVKAALASLDPGIEVSGYDPAIPERAESPAPADFVICTDVMEHVEEQYVANVLDNIHSLARKGAFFCIALTKAKRNLPDGSNAHITLKTVEWWMGHIRMNLWSDLDVKPGKKSLKVWLKKSL